MADAMGRFRSPEGTYLLNHSVGVPPVSASAVATALADEWLTTPHDAWPRWEREIEGFHAELGQLMNNDAQWFCHQQNVSSGLAKVLQALPVDAGRPAILLAERSFPTIGYVAKGAQRLGYRTRMLPKDVDLLDLEVWRQALTDDVGVVVLTHAESNAGIHVPVGEIAELVREHGATCVVDVAQSAGVLPIDLHQWNVDFVLGTSVKWLCGGPGAGFLWVNPAAIDRCAPIDVGWFSHDDPFEFDINDFRFAPDARRFWGGTPSPIPAAIARESIAAINHIGVENVREHNVELADRLIGGLDPSMLISPSDRSRRSGTIVIDPGADLRPLLLARLAEAEIHVDERADGIRVSPHLVNSREDIDGVLQVVSEVCS